MPASAPACAATTRRKTPPAPVSRPASLPATLRRAFRGHELSMRRMKRRIERKRHIARRAAVARSGAGALGGEDERGAERKHTLGGQLPHVTHIGLFRECTRRIEARGVDRDDALLEPKRV